jgi:hypothetical protein
MSEALKKLLEAARNVVMSEKDREAQRRSFAYGNTHFENPDITRAMVDRQADKLAEEEEAGRPA